MSTCCSTTEGSCQKKATIFIMCLRSEFFRIEGASTTSIKLFCLDLLTSRAFERVARL